MSKHRDPAYPPASPNDIATTVVSRDHVDQVVVIQRATPDSVQLKLSPDAATELVAILTSGAHVAADPALWENVTRSLKSAADTVYARPHPALAQGGYIPPRDRSSVRLLRGGDQA